MAILAFLIDLFSGAMLLLFSVHFMRIGVERIWSERIRHGNVLSSGSSDQHLAIIAILKEINSKLATIGYAIVDDLGGLRKSRVKPSFGE